jgi:hypothetical protein
LSPGEGSPKPADMISGLIESLGWFVRGLVKKILRATWTLIRPGLRVISVVAVVGAVVALTSDFTRWQTGAEGPLFQSFAGILTEIAPATFEGLGRFVALKLHPVVWDPVLTGLLSLPAWFLLFSLALLTGYAARDRETVDIFVN